MSGKLSERSILQFHSEIGTYLSSLCDGFSDTRLGELLGLSVGRILLKESRLGSDWRSIASDDQLRHIADWLKASIINEDAWLTNVDGHGRPKKLMKFASIDQITQEANKAMMKASQRLSCVKLVEGDEELYTELDDGYHIVRLLTPAALDRESSQMQHCIGDGAYDEQLTDGGFLYLSLRDASGKAHVTMEVRDDALVQIQGKQNEPPVRKYIDRLIPFIKEQRIAVYLPVCVFNHVIDDQGGWHHIDALPDNLTVSGSLNFRGSDISRLPDGMTVGVCLFLDGTGITDLPSGLTVGVDLSLMATNITSLPADLSVGRVLCLDGATSLTFLPKGLSVFLDLDLRGSGITSLPSGLSVGGDLNLKDTKITSLPADISVGRDLKLAGSNVTSLPEGLSIGGSLSLRGLNIENLPGVLSVGRDLDVRGTSITELPAGVSVGGKILSDSPLIEMPSNMVFRLVRRYL